MEGKEKSTRGLSLQRQKRAFDRRRGKKLTVAKIWVNTTANITRTANGRKGKINPGSFVAKQKKGLLIEEEEETNSCEDLGKYDCEHNADCKWKERKNQPGVFRCKDKKRAFDRRKGRN